jgi:hypothetical protein
MTPDIHEDALQGLSDPVLTLDSIGEAVNIEAGETPQGPGPGDETVMSWARAM